MPAINHLFQFCAIVDDIGTFAHAHSKTDRLLPVIAEHLARGVLIAAPDVGDIGQAKEAVADAQVDVFKAVGVGELPRHPHQNPFGPGIDHARGQNGVLGRQRQLHFLLVQTRARPAVRWKTQEK